MGSFSKQMTEVFNKSLQTAKRQYLRKHMPPAELKLWEHIKARQINGRRFRRQYGIRNYIVDFYSPELKLIIEIDGDSHFQENRSYDKKRQQYIESLGLKVLRFTNHEVYYALEQVLNTIKQQTSK